MRITARFVCTANNQLGQAEHDRLGAIAGETYMEQVTMTAIHSAGPEDPNRTYSQATPNAKLEMTITNRAAFGAFKPGHIYDLVFDEHVRERAPFVTTVGDSFDERHPTLKRGPSTDR